jgi:cell division septation protein DedD
MKAAVVFLTLIFLTIVINHILFPTPKEVLISPEPEFTFEELDAQKVVDESQPAVSEKPVVSAKAPVAPVNVTANAQLASTAPALAPSKVPAQTVSGDFYSIQVASVRDKANAEVLAEKLRKEGYESEVITKDFKSGTWSIVFVGRYGTKAEAEVKLSQMKAKFQDSFIKLRKAS